MAYYSTVQYVLLFRLVPSVISRQNRRVVRTHTQKRGRQHLIPTTYVTTLKKLTLLLLLLLLLLKLMAIFRFALLLLLLLRYREGQSYNTTCHMPARLLSSTRLSACLPACLPACCSVGHTGKRPNDCWWLLNPPKGRAKSKSDKCSVLPPRSTGSIQQLLPPPPLPLAYSSAVV